MCPCPDTPRVHVRIERSLGAGGRGGDSFGYYESRGGKLPGHGTCFRQLFVIKACAQWQGPIRKQQRWMPRLRSQSAEDMTARRGRSKSQELPAEQGLLDFLQRGKAKARGRLSSICSR